MSKYKTRPISLLSKVTYCQSLSYILLFFYLIEDRMFLNFARVNLAVMSPQHSLSHKYMPKSRIAFLWPQGFYLDNAKLFLKVVHQL